MAGWLAFAALTATAAGCGDGAPRRVAVQGRVQYDGRPLGNGSIRFIPLPGTSGPESGATILNGRYQLESAGGPPVGKLRVEIRQALTLPTDLTHDSAALKYKGFQFPKNELPPEYNDRSTLFVEAVAGKLNNFDFDLKRSQ